MARRWKMAALTMAWLGGALPVEAQNPPPPVPIAVSGIGNPGMGYLPVAQAGPGGPMAPWNPPMPGGGPRPPAGGGMPGGGMPGGGMPGGGGPACPPGEGGAIDLDTNDVRFNAFNDEDGDYRGRRCQFSLEFLQIWTRSHRHPVLLTTSSDVTDPIPGALDQPNTVVLHDTHTGAGSSSAFRLNYTYFLCDPEVLSIDTSFMVMEQRRLIFAIASNDEGDPPLLRPFFDAAFKGENADPRAFSVAKRGSVEDNFYTRLMGAEANLTWNVSGTPACHGPACSLLAGPRWIRLDEKYISHDTSQDLPAGTGQTFLFSDDFTCYNEFFGGQVGLSVRNQWERLTFDLVTKIAVGPNFQTLQITGQTIQRDDVSGVITTANNQGLYAQPTNFGIHRETPVSIIPQLDLKVGFHLNDNFKFTVGYGMFYMTNVVRAGDSLDRKINVQPLNSAVLLPPLAPQGRINNSDYWANWVSFGFEWVF